MLRAPKIVRRIALEATIWASFYRKGSLFSMIL